MHYKTLVLGLLKQHPRIHNQLRRRRMLLPTLELYAKELRNHHQAWKHRLSQRKLESDSTQIASEALEMALKELEDGLRSAVPPDNDQPLPLDAAVTSIRGRTPSA